MSRKGLRSLADLLQSSDIARLKSEAAKRRELAREARSSLPDDQAAHLVGASQDSDGTLVLVMDSPVWAARVRYAGRQFGGRPVRVKVVPG